jgi:hypothetical protein
LGQHAIEERGAPLPRTNASPRRPLGDCLVEGPPRPTLLGRRSIAPCRLEVAPVLLRLRRREPLCRRGMRRKLLVVPRAVEVRVRRCSRAEGRHQGGWHAASMPRRSRRMHVPAADALRAGLIRSRCS